jgi:hypothetical protein
VTCFPVTRDSPSSTRRRSSSESAAALRRMICALPAASSASSWYRSAMDGRSRTRPFSIRRWSRFLSPGARRALVLSRDAISLRSVQAVQLDRRREALERSEGLGRAAPSPRPSPGSADPPSPRRRAPGRTAARSRRPS